MKTTSVTATKARQNFFEIIKDTHDGKTYTITINGDPKIVMMSAEEFEGWQETLEIMSDPELAKSIKASLKSTKKEKTYTQEEVENMFNIK